VVGGIMADLLNIKGIGAKGKTYLNKLGIMDTNDLLTYYPVRYDLLKRSNLSEVTEEDRVIIDGKVESIPLILRFNKGLNKMNFRLVTQNGVVGVSIFNRAFMKKNLEIGTNVIVIGKYDSTKKVITASDIRSGVLGKEEKIEPVYHLTTGITSKSIHTFINLGLLVYGRKVPDYIPDYLLDKYGYLNKKTSLNIIHNPSDLTKLEEVRNRLKYEELFTFMTKINYLKERNKKDNGIGRNIDVKELEEFYKTLPFELTNDQKKVILEIITDMNSKKMMNRLLQGDVGSGKTIVSIVAMYFNKLSGYQSALMAPTEILATQHYNNIKKLLGKKVNVELLIGSKTKKEKNDIYKKLETGEIDIIIGTHALIQEDVKYYNLGLVVTDEQHRFGVNQRANLKNKGMMLDVLYMSATPIPRTFALTIYGDMDVSIIKEMPKGRMPIKTYVKKNEEIPEVLEMMYEELKLKHQIYVIAPLIEDSENSELTSVNNLKDKMNLAFGSKYNIDVLHGKMAGALKDDIMLKFKNNETQILISTTVVEVGVDVPNASMMVIFDANRFGLSTLHQLRGRVGRGKVESTCVLISSQETERLDILSRTNDGFEIAEEDFKLRGSGDLFGTRQSGDMNFRIANIKEDYHLLVQANKDAKEFIKNKDSNYDLLKQTILASIDTD
jgi:ATP-dependent DNA helicase RecG